ncbi:MAG: hypothetical protein AAF063_15015 [Cyanobacteria bacterium J06643_5]
MIQEQTLLEQIKNILQTQELSEKMQRELAILLFLRSILEERRNDRSNQKIKIVDLAILTLLENRGQDKKNQVFIKQIRKALRHESIQPNALLAMLFGHGGSYNRLISGLTWYFIAFVIFPSLITGSIFLGANFLRPTKVEKDDLIRVVNNQQGQLEKANEINNNLLGALKQVDLLIPKNSQSLKPSNQTQELTKLPSINKRIEEIEKILQEAEKKNTELIEIQVKEIEQSKLDFKIETESRDKLEIENLKTANSWFLEQDLFFISLAISMGALGSITSIIVRSKEFIQKSEDEEKDLFFVGFLRPFVGMSFAILVVALIESGIFLSISGIPDNSPAIEQRERTSRTVYYYMAIAFIAGFSERLVQDLISNTENKSKNASSDKA